MTARDVENEIRPSRNRATATSLAAFSTTGRLRSASSASIGEAKARKSRRVGPLEFERPAAPDPATEASLVHRSGYGKGVLNRQPHVGDTKLCNERAIDEFDNRVHHRLRMNDDVDLVRAERRRASGPR